ncbi:uncharacterized protein [Amphiura filiformis]|uniref:uncharacterized protein n=1 Tax=Amphiura filiformis TaxID=82378 RepID=UPI003B20C26B
MSFNASKCQVLRVTNKRKPTLACYSIHGHTLEIVNTAKYLGVHLDSKLSFNSHIDTITKKANSTKAFLSRNISHCSQKVKEAAYSTFIRPTVEYAASAWDTQRNNKKLEQVHQNSARFVMGSSVTSVLRHLNWTSLQDRRLVSRLLMMFKIRFDLVDIPWNHYLTLHSSSTRGHSSRFMQPHTNSSVFANSYFPRTIRDWNNLPVDPLQTFFYR